MHNVLLAIVAGMHVAASNHAAGIGFSINHAAAAPREEFTLPAWRPLTHGPRAGNAPQWHVVAIHPIVRPIGRR